MAEQERKEREDREGGGSRGEGRDDVVVREETPEETREREQHRSRGERGREGRV